MQSADGTCISRGYQSQKLELLTLAITPVVCQPHDPQVPVLRKSWMSPQTLHVRWYRRVPKLVIGRS